eukprot:TRINITY_DN360_c0_g1_i6.p1 TRINITY_DN360_c0_g1~~TRINITY_DN360_c0_g1_i6.p1  ORF type:complete len:1008 (+),score=320.83 TRINITY_DN360_c0_g1_i6:471-3494(+)
MTPEPKPGNRSNDLSSSFHLLSHTFSHSHTLTLIPTYCLTKISFWNRCMSSLTRAWTFCPPDFFFLCLFMKIKLEQLIHPTRPTQKVQPKFIHSILLPSSSSLLLFSFTLSFTTPPIRSPCPRCPRCPPCPFSVSCANITPARSPSSFSVSSSSRTNPSVIRIKPNYYIHVLDNNDNVTRVVVGPQTFVRKDHETLVHGPDQMITVPTRHYCVIKNPAIFEGDQVVTTEHGQVKLRYGDTEIRSESEPFALYPGEQLVGEVQPLTVVKANEALRLKALRDFTDDDNVDHVAGDEWLFPGPATYHPHVAVASVETVRARIIKPNTGLRLKARRAFDDTDGDNKVERKAGEEWIVRKEGAYMPSVYEEVVGFVKAVVLTEKTALHLRAIRTFTDVFGKERKAGEEWLVRLSDADTHIPDVNEENLGEVSIQTLTKRQYCVVLNPYKNGKPQLGQRELRKGEQSFFLLPGESFEDGIQSVHVLSEDEAILLRAKEEFTDDKGELHKPGQRWMIHGPIDYVPPVEVEILEIRPAIPLDDNEGIYVRDVRSGKVRYVSGESYMLQASEELWEKDLPKAVEDLLAKDLDPYADRNAENHESSSSSSDYRRSGKGRRSGGRDKSRVVTFRVPHNAAVQIYDYKEKNARVVFGPELVMLGPDEQFTVLNLSGGKPKKPNSIRSLALLLGPDFMTDIVKVETSDHARLQLQLSYNWHFDISEGTESAAAKIFQVPDFVGDACKAIASRVRGAVAMFSFDQFHKESADIIRKAVFGDQETLRFKANNLVISNVDIQSVEPVDQRTRDSLQKSVQLAIEITTKSQEASAKHKAERVEQEARGRLERQKIKDMASAEEARKSLLQLQAESNAIEAKGRAEADARAKAEAAQIEGTAAVKQADLKAQAMKIESQAELDQIKSRQDAELEHQSRVNKLEVEKYASLAKIETTKFENLVKAIGSDTISKIAQSGPKLQVEMLQALNLNGFLITDGKSPVNLFNTAQGMIANTAANSFVSDAE